MNNFIHSYNTFLLEVKRILERQEQEDLLKGEKFNVFSILRMTSKEDKLHSQFIKELLHPEGSHNKGRIFLDLFLNMLNENIKSSQSKGESEESETPALIDYEGYDDVQREFHISGKNLQKKTGGRVDLLLKDSKSGNTICIENKIYAGDQQAQVERYCNFNPNKTNLVFYLTLTGKEPSSNSRGKKESGKDFFLLSYKDDIISWLDQCLKEAHDHPILRESIRQYQITLKKLTHTMEDQNQQQLEALMLNNLNEAYHVRDNLDKILNRIRDNFRRGIAKQLRIALQAELPKINFIVEGFRKVHEKHSVLFVKVTDTSPFIVGIETWSGHPDGHFGGDMFIGLYNRESKTDITGYAEEFNTYSHRWSHFEMAKYDNDKRINLSDKDFLIKIHDIESDSAKLVIDNLVNQTVEFLKTTNDLLKDDHKIFHDLPITTDITTK